MASCAFQSLRSIPSTPFQVANAGSCAASNALQKESILSCAGSCKSRLSLPRGVYLQRRLSGITNRHQCRNNAVSDRLFSCTQGRPIRPSITTKRPKGKLTRRNVQANASKEAVRVDQKDVDAFLAGLPESPGRKIYTVSLQKPLGIFFKDDSEGPTVDEVVEGGHAAAFNKTAKQDQIQVGDRLLATTAFPEGQGQFKNQEPILFATGGEKFETVIAAIQSNTCANCYITLVLDGER